MKCSCRKLREGFLFEVREVPSNLVSAVEKAYFRKEEDAFIKYCPASIREMKKVAGNFAKLAPDAFEANGSNWRQALLAFCKVANEAGINYTVFGSVTFALHDINMQPHDLDILVEESDFLSVPGLFPDCEIEPFWDFEDALLLVRYFGRLCIDTTWLDVSAGAKAAMHIGDTERMEIDGVPFLVQTVESCLSAYRQSGQTEKAELVRKMTWNG